MKKIIKSIILIFIVCVFNISHAADISLYSNTTDIKTGDEFIVDVFVHTDLKINAVEGKLIYPKNNLEIKEIRDGNSVVNFWIEKPQDNDGIISFSGITPAGFNGNNKKLFSIVFKAKNIGETMINLDDVKLLTADGHGTNSLSNIFNLNLNIKKGADNSIIEILTDIESPENFNPIISSDSNIFDGKKFIVFATQDKDSGMSHFEIKEGWLDFYKKAESPYILKDQKLSKEIKIKAIDLNGNERIVIVNAQNPRPWYKHYEIFGLILLGVIIILFKRKYGKNN